MTKIYPRYICASCGEKYGNNIPQEGFSWHIAHCGLCERHAIVGEPSEFSHLRSGWEMNRQRTIEEGEK